MHLEVDSNLIGDKVEPSTAQCRVDDTLFYARDSKDIDDVSLKEFGSSACIRQSKTTVVENNWCYCYKTDVRSDRILIL